MKLPYDFNYLFCEILNYIWNALKEIWEVKTIMLFQLNSKFLSLYRKKNVEML